MQPSWNKTNSALWAEDFQGIAGLSSDDSLLVGVSTARKRSFNNRPRAVKHRLGEPGQIIPQHGCVPALPASVSPGRANFSGKATKVVRAAQNQASAIAHTGLEVKQLFSTSGRGRIFFLTSPFIDESLINRPIFVPRGEDPELHQ